MAHTIQDSMSAAMDLFCRAVEEGQPVAAGTTIIRDTMFVAMDLFCRAVEEGQRVVAGTTIIRDTHTHTHTPYLSDQICNHVELTFSKGLLLSLPLSLTLVVVVYYAARRARRIQNAPARIPTREENPDEHLTSVMVTGVCAPFRRQPYD